ncbi:hypothetical protein [Flavobacterium covae]|uniref:hypothetical protein n=1 Tax=Flavobacterium covae TaxID=2906076 RepID=UPI000745C3CC|nr:hypothetical protein [Flavobacterium covae]AMA50441.1 hypothetical protein AWN65_13720 [Flavobacterium covae]MCJ1809082.1 hypothetical protein [Flavobacterium covae]
MIDGVKIKCIGTDTSDWERSPLLKFCTKVDTTTGEILAKNRVAFYRGLSFHITPSTITDKNHLFIRGSLATYYNQGKHNAYDFTREMLIEVLAELQEEFKINPQTAVIQSFEYGANIATEKPVKAIVNGLRAYQSDRFTMLKIEGKPNGLQLDRSKTAVKFYDKAKQANLKDSNLMRIEYVVKYHQTAVQHGFNVLADFLALEKLNNLKPYLLEVWRNTIFHDDGMRWREMNTKQKEKMLYYLDANNWERFNKGQRQKARVKFRALYNMFCSSKTQIEIGNLLSEKLNELEAKKGYHFQNFSDEFGSQNEMPKKIPFSPLDELEKGIQNTSKNDTQTESIEFQNNTTKTTPKKCLKCGAVLKHKNSNSKYCSKKCNNSIQAENRKMKRENIKTLENEILRTLIQNLSRSNFELLIEYSTQTGTYSDQLEQAEINAPKEWSLKVTRVTILQKPKNLVLTSWRAKKLIKLISKQNNKVTI